MIAACFVLAIFILVMIVVVVTLECTAEEATIAGLGELRSSA